MAATAGRSARLYLQSGTATSFTSGGMSTSNNLRFTMTAASARHWDYSTTPTISVGGVVQTSGYSVERCGGNVVFTSATTGTVTANGSFRTVSAIAEAKEWNLDVDNEYQEDPAFGDSGVTRVFIGQDAAGSFSDWHTDSYLLTFAESTTPYVVAFYIDNATGARYEGYFFCSKDGVKTGAKQLIEGEASLVACQVSGEDQAVYYRAT